MAGRGDKGPLITTGTFSADAKKETTRDGAPPIDLIDGDRLYDLLKKYDLGVSTTTRTVEDIAISVAFFAEIWHRAHVTAHAAASASRAEQLYEDYLAERTMETGL